MEGQVVSLTTPERLTNYDVYTEEGYFLYWETSHVLWDGLISAHFSQKYLIIPVNWAAHLVDGSYEFGEKRADLNLKEFSSLFWPKIRGKKVMLNGNSRIFIKNLHPYTRFHRK